MSNVSNDSVVSGAADPAFNSQAETVQPAAAQGEAGEPSLFVLEDFNLDDIEVIESKVFA